MPGVILPDFNDLERCAGVLESVASSLRNKLKQVEGEAFHMNREFEGFDTSVFRNALHAIRLARYLESLLAIDPKTLTSPYMQERS